MLALTASAKLPLPTTILCCDKISEAIQRKGTSRLSKLSFAAADAWEKSSNKAKFKGMSLTKLGRKLNLKLVSIAIFAVTIEGFGVDF
ncbi:hypothetical protein D3C85_1109820 [compost metagenome]